MHNDYTAISFTSIKVSLLSIAAWSAADIGDTCMSYNATWKNPSNAGVMNPRGSIAYPLIMIGYGWMIQVAGFILILVFVIILC